MTTTAATSDQAIIDLGSEWVKGDMHRVYFNRSVEPGQLSLDEAYGLSWNYESRDASERGTYLDQTHIPTAEAQRIQRRLNDAKVWFDFADGKFHARGLDQADFERVVAGIRARVASLSA